jgi:hypothetical protein
MLDTEGSACFNSRPPLEGNDEDTEDKLEPPSESVVTIGEFASRLLVASSGETPVLRAVIDVSSACIFVMSFGLKSRE